MGHFAKVDNGFVTQVIVAEQDVIDSGMFGTGWVQTSYNTRAGEHPENRPLRKNYAGIDYTYDAVRDAFIPPQPLINSFLNETTCAWEAPQNENSSATHVWDSVVQSWVNPQNLTVVDTNVVWHSNNVVQSINSTNASNTIVGADSTNGVV